MVYWFLFDLYISVCQRINSPPAENDPIFSAEATSNDWSYESQRVYIGSLKLDIIIKDTMMMMILKLVIMNMIC